MMWTTVVLALSVMVSSVTAITKPVGCSYASGVFTCDYRFVIPLDATAFSPEPQRLVIEEADGTFSNTDFLNFDQVNKTAFDINSPAELTIICITGGGGLMSLDATSFEGMAYFQEIRIINCEFTAVAANAFQNFGAVNHFSFEGGNMDSIDADALVGLNVERDTTLPTPKGTFAMIDVDLVPGGLPTGFFSNMTHANEIILSNSRLYSIDPSLFSTTALARKINLDNNPFTYIPDNIFASVTALGQVSMAGIQWECTCNNLWFLDHFEDNSILFTSAATCTIPSSHYGKTVYAYYNDVCDSGLDCDGGDMPAVNLGGVTCLTVLQIVIYIFAIFGFFGAGAALAIAIHTKRQIGGAGGAPGAARPGGGPKRGAGNRVSQRPPNGTRPPVKKNAFK